MLLKFAPVPPLHNLTLSTGSACRRCCLQVRDSWEPLSSHRAATYELGVLLPGDTPRLGDHPLQGGYCPAAVFPLNRNIYFHLFFCLKTPSLTLRWDLLGPDQEVIGMTSSPLSQNHHFWPWGTSWAPTSVLWLLPSWRWALSGRPFITSCKQGSSWVCLTCLQPGSSCISCPSSSRCKSVKQSPGSCLRH